MHIDTPPQRFFEEAVSECRGNVSEPNPEIRLAVFHSRDELGEDGHADRKQYKKHYHKGRFFRSDLGFEVFPPDQSEGKDSAPGQPIDGQPYIPGKKLFVDYPGEQAENQHHYPDKHEGREDGEFLLWVEF